MARLPRAVMPGHPHLLIHRGHSAQPVFLDARDSALYLACLHEAARGARVALHAYALFASESRLLATPEAADGLAQLMQSAGRRYVPAFNKRHSRTGTPWEGRFRSVVIEPGDAFLASLRFIEAPGAGDVAWPSSLAHHLGLRVDPLLTDHPSFWTFGNTPFEREAAYRRFIEQAPAPGEVATILLAARNSWAIGSEEFRSMVAQHTGRRSQPAARGRPRKPPQPEAQCASIDVSPLKL